MRSSGRHGSGGLHNLATRCGRSLHRDGVLSRGYFPLLPKGGAETEAGRWGTGPTSGGGRHTWGRAWCRRMHDGGPLPWDRGFARHAYVPVHRALHRGVGYDRLRRHRCNGVAAGGL
ncbi:hypothetical protein GCM10022207_63630 [Streptomyces lannensis]|uniref:Uncharacterized protein n=1 Tax=Streptomyces lannensis TaxID=766498 RepID=A0ABP7KWT4_9ACTN